MAESRTLEFESARALGQLFLNDPGNLRLVEEKLKVKLTTREGWLKVEGDAEALDRVETMFRQLSEAMKSGVPIRRYEFNYAIRSANDPEAPGLDKLASTRISCSTKRPPIIPKTAMQREYIEAIQTHDMVFGIGPAGTGKTYLAMALAVAALKKELVQRIILTRPAVEAGEALGFLPGDLQEKIMPYLRPLYDALHDMMDPEEMQRCFERGIIEIAPLAYMRGRTLNRAFVILDEAQNTTTEQMFMFLTRLGTDSRAVITGDPTQIDLPHNKRSGLAEALSALQSIEGIHFQRFQEKDVIRHELVQRIVSAYRNHRGTKSEVVPTAGGA
jgi:phosphate starvation-inducible PhoH-like protein